jgi:hypothetical protein
VIVPVHALAEYPARLTPIEALPLHGIKRANRKDCADHQKLIDKKLIDGLALELFSTLRPALKNCPYSR